MQKILTVKKSNVLVYFLQVCYILYYSAGVLYSSGVVSNIFLLLIVVVSFYHMIKLRTTNKFPKWLIGFILIQIVYYVLTRADYVSVKGDIVTCEYTLKTMLLALISFIPFYANSRKYGCVGNTIFFFVAFFFLAVLKFVLKKSELSVTAGGDEVGLNVAYSFVSMLPFAILYYKKRWLSISIVIVVCVMLLLAMKRGAILVAACALAVYFVFFMKETFVRKTKYKGLIVLLTVSLVLLFCIVLYYFALSNSNLVSRFENIEEGSGRDVIYMTYITNWYLSPSVLEMIFGQGMNTTVSLMGYFAHSDYIELLLTEGLFGVFYYCSGMFILAKQIRCSYDKQDKIILMMILLIWCISAIFSMFYLESNSFVYMMLLGMVMGALDNKKQKLRCIKY